MIFAIAASTWPTSLPMIRPTATSGSSSVSFFVEYGLSDGIPPGPVVNVGTSSSSPMIVT